MGLPSRGVLLCGVVMALVSSSGFAGEIVVEPEPAAQPVLAKALASAADGDTIRVRPGVYREAVVINRGVVLVGEPGAVIDPSEPFQPQWQPAPEIGSGVYRAEVPVKPASLFLDGKVFAEVDERRTDPRTDGWATNRLLAAGGPDGGFTYIRGLWMYRAKENAIYVHLADDADPAPLAWTVQWKNEPAVTFRGAVGASISGLTIAHAFQGVRIDDQSRECRVSRCVIGHWDREGVLITGGSSDCIIEENEIFRGSYEDLTPHPAPKERYEVWRVHKTVGFYDRPGVNVFRAGSNTRIRANHVYETFDGINVGDYAVEMLEKLMDSPEDGKGTEIWDNVIERTRDSGMELGAGCIDVRVHDNVFRQTFGGLRYKGPRIGPVFIYRNVFEQAGMSFVIWYSMLDSPAEGYVYHNTILSGKVALVYSSFTNGKGAGIGAPNWHYVNNLVLTDRGLFENWKVENAPVNFTADYNVVSAGGKPWPDDTSRDAHSRYGQPIDLDADHQPSATSAAIDAGLDLSTYYHGGPLPGCEPGYFQGSAPDAGAVEVR